MYYPVQVPGALLSIGDPHVSQGDGEVSGTALEASLNGLLRFTIRRDLPFTMPVLETATELLVHGFGDTLDGAMKAAALRTHGILQGYFGLSRADAYSFMSVAADFPSPRSSISVRVVWPYRRASFPAGRGYRRGGSGIRSFTFIHTADGVPPAVRRSRTPRRQGRRLYVTGQMPTDVTGAVVGDYVAIQTSGAAQPDARHRVVRRGTGRRRLGPRLPSRLE
jgi:hypothetical protein